MFKKIIACGMCLVLMLTGCSRDMFGGGSFSEGTTRLTANVDVTELNYDETSSQKSVSSLASASVKLLSEIVKAGDKKDNYLISPLSIITAIAMTENGAYGETYDQMEEIVNGGVSIDELNPFLHDMSERLQDSKSVDWNIANSAWFKDDGMWEIIPEFAAKSKQYYDADIFAAKFDESTVSDINRWASDNTDGMIDNVLTTIPDMAVMYLINAVAFDGEWEEKYEDSDIITGEEFTNYDDWHTKVTMLHSEEEKYFRLGDGDGFLKPYKGDDYSFFGILPRGDRTPEEYLQGLVENEEDIAGAIRDYIPLTVYAGIPEFTDDYDVELLDIFEKMGMTTPFDPDRADLTGIIRANADEYHMWISRILHKTHIEVDRHGTRAAAITMEQVTGDAAAPDEEKYIILDRPFVYGIVDNETGFPVFIGVVNSLS